VKRYHHSLVTKMFSVKAEKTLRLILLAIFAAAVIGMVVPKDGSLLPHMRSVQQLWIIGHILVFFSGCFLLYWFFPWLAKWPLYEQLLLILSATLLISIAIEGIQAFIPGRFASLKDIAANLAGSMAAISLKNLRRRRTLPLHIATACVLVFFFWPMLRSLTDEAIAYYQFPLLAGFQTPFEETRFRGDPGRLEITDQRAYYGNRSLRVNLGTETYSGFSLAYMPGNWQGYSYLKVAFYNPQPREVTITNRIHDKAHGKSGKMLYEDRFNRRFTLQPEKWTMLEISLADVKTAPQNRKMGMTSINNIGFFVTREPEPLTLYIDAIRLE